MSLVIKATPIKTASIYFFTAITADNKQKLLYINDETIQAKFLSNIDKEVYIVTKDSMNVTDVLNEKEFMNYSINKLKA